MFKQGDMKNFFSFLLIIPILGSSFLFAWDARAASASLYLTPSSGTYTVGARFSVGVNVNTGGLPINAAQGAINYDSNVLKVVGVSKGNVFTLWTTEPKANGGAISFGGGVPHPGYTGSAGRIITITFQALKIGSGGVRFSSGYVLANDGKGTNILSSMGSGNYTISARQEAPKEKSKEIPKKEKPKEIAISLKPEITSETHPNEDKWYKEKRVRFGWKLPEMVAGVSISLNQKEIADPGPASDGLFDGKEYEIEKDGHYYLHVKFKDSKGRWGTIAHFRINVDTTPPKSFEVEVKQEDKNDLPSLFFETSDELSGVDRYEVSIDSLQNDPIIIKVEDKFLKLADISIGSHTAVVKAIDKAGNEIYTSVEFDIPAIDTPVVLEYSEEISLDDKFFVSGTSTLDTTISIFIKRDGNEEEKMYKAESDQNGNWFLVVRDKLDKGMYTFWVEGENKNGLKSTPSSKFSFLVTPPIFARIGTFVVDYFTVIVSLIFMIVLTVFLMTLLILLIRKKLKKETIEIEDVLERNMSELQRVIDRELSDINKVTKAEIKRKLSVKVSEINQKILKEIKDVEKILRIK